VVSLQIENNPSVRTGTLQEVGILGYATAGVWGSILVLFIFVGIQKIRKERAETAHTKTQF